MKRRIRDQARRRGAIAPLTALLITVILGMVAFSVDTSWMVLTETELQNAADAAALAGANPLMEGHVQYHLPGQTDAQKTVVMTSVLASARAQAIACAALNGAGGVSSLTLRSEDIEFGYMDSAGNYTAQPTYTGFPNTIKVLLRRDTTANQPLGLFFGRILGTATANLQATASATLYAGAINSYTGTAGMLPMTYDINYWNNFVQTGKDPDGNKSYDADGNPTLQTYPSIKDTGNFGLLSLNDSHSNANEIRSWIINGISTSDLQALVNSSLLPLSSHNASLWDWQGQPGFEASSVMTVNDYIGKTFVLPLFTPYQQSSTSSSSSDGSVVGTIVNTVTGKGNSNGGGNSSTTTEYQAGVGQGSNYYYNIVQFVGVKISQPAATNRDVVVQPAAIIEPNASFVPGSIAPVGSTLVTTFTSPKLTR